eukprot:1688757-Pleurochrysis_carterae.AAC.4
MRDARKASRPGVLLCASPFAALSHSLSVVPSLSPSLLLLASTLLELLAEKHMRTLARGRSEGERVHEHASISKKRVRARARA